VCGEQLSVASECSLPGCKSGLARGALDAVTVLDVKHYRDEMRNVRKRTATIGRALPALRQFPDCMGERRWWERLLVGFIPRRSQIRIHPPLPRGALRGAIFGF
jgi:hypothetical protein